MIFIDTGAFIARYLAKDQFHESAFLYWEKLGKKHQKLYTSNFVIDEALTVLGRRAGYRFASDRARNIYYSDSLDILRPDEDDELRAVDLFEKYSNLKLSFTDSISFVLMKKHKIKRAFTFDKHFELAGFRAVP